MTIEKTPVLTPHEIINKLESEVAEQKKKIEDYCLEIEEGNIESERLEKVIEERDRTIARLRYDNNYWQSRKECYLEIIGKLVDAFICSEEA